MSKAQHNIWLFGLLFLFSQSSFALSLGEIKVISTFAQPFLAEIKLPSYTADEMESIQINLASKKQFEERNIEMTSILKKFHFSVEEKKNGSLYIKVHTKTPVKELSISFLIEVTWTGGRIIKSYDILLTPEAVTEFWEKRANDLVAELNLEIEQSEVNQVAPLVQHSVKNIKKKKPVLSQHIAQASPSKKNTKSRNNKVRKTKNGGLEYSNVGRGESLSLIAQQMRPDKNMSINQVMVALFEENREAFMNNDINRLLAGVTLKIDNVDNVTSISKREAMKLAQRYLKGPVSDTMVAQNDSSTEEMTEQTPEVLEPEGNRLEISSSNEEPIPQEILEQIKSEQIASAEEELKMALMDADTLRTENNELKDRITKLENQLDTTTDNLFMATIQQEIVKDSPELNSLTQQDQNLIVENTELAMAGEEKLSLMQRIEKYQTAISISSATLLSMTLIGIRKKEQILNIIHDLKDKLKNKLHKENDIDDSQFS